MIGGAAWVAVTIIGGRRRRKIRNLPAPAAISGDLLRLVDSVEKEARELIPRITAGSSSQQLRPMDRLLIDGCHANYQSTKSWHFKEMGIALEKLNEGISEFNGAPTLKPPYELFQRCHAILAAGARIRTEIRRAAETGCSGN
jgi:hypothetical protein